MDPIHTPKAKIEWALSPQSQVSPLRCHRCAQWPTQSARSILWWPEQTEKRVGLHYICFFRPSVDRRQKVGSLTPHPVQALQESWHPQRPTQGKGCSPDSDVKTGEGHQGTTTSRFALHQCTSTLWPGWDKSRMWHYPSATPSLSLVVEFTSQHSMSQVTLILFNYMLQI